jgi:adenylyl-sulfate kinase
MKTIWLTGISGAGKSTIANLYKTKFDKSVILIDGDVIRNTINAHLGFTSEDRNKNIETCARICKMLNDDGHFVIASISSPLEKQREIAKKIIGKQNFFLVYVACSIDGATSRDPKGLYARYFKGEIKNMAGLDLPYEAPENPILTLNTEYFDALSCVKTLRATFLKHKFERNGTIDSIQHEIN